MKKSLLVVALLSAFAPMVAQAEAGDIVVRLRATNVNPNTKSSLGETTAATYAALVVSPQVLLVFGLTLVARKRTTMSPASA